MALSDLSVALLLWRRSVGGSRSGFVWNRSGGTAPQSFLSCKRPGHRCVVRRAVERGAGALLRCYHRRAVDPGWRRHMAGVQPRRRQTCRSRGLSLVRLLGQPRLEVGWAVRQHLWGHGYATEIGRSALEVAFDQRGAEEVVALRGAQRELTARDGTPRDDVHATDPPTRARCRVQRALRRRPLRALPHHSSRMTDVHGGAAGPPRQIRGAHPVAPVR